MSASYRIKWGVAQTIPGFHLRASDGSIKVNPTLSTGLVKISKDSGAEANLATLPSVNPSGSCDIDVPLSATEAKLTAGVINFRGAAGGEWVDDSLHISTPLADGCPCGAATGTLTTTQTQTTDLTNTQTDAYKDVFITYVSGANKDISRKITASSNSAGTTTLTHNAFPSAASSGDAFEIINGA